MMSETQRSALYYPFHLCHEQTLAHLAEASPQESEDRTDALRRFDIRIDPPGDNQVVADRLFIVRREGEGPPLADGSLETLTVGAHRIECRKINDGPLACTKDGAPMAGEEVERLTAALPGFGDSALMLGLGREAGPAGAAEDRKMFILQKRRPAE